MGLKNFLIEFDNVERSYFAGQVVSGKVILEIHQEKKIEALELNFFGNGNVQWKAFSNSGASKNYNNNNNNNNTNNRSSNKKLNNSKNSKNGKSQYPRNVSAEEIYLNKKIILVEKIQEDTDLILQPGKYEYTFEFQIPSDSPSTFLGPYGHVKYFVSAILTRPNFKRQHEIKVPFTVNGILDLNILPSTMVKLNEESIVSSSSSSSSSSDGSIHNMTKTKPQQQQQLQIQLQNPRRQSSDYSIGEIKKFTKSSPLTPFLCLNNKSVGFLLRLPRVAFVPGEYIQFVAEMRNMSKVDVSGVTLSLIQETKYYAEDETKSGQKIIISSAKGPSVNCGETETWETNESDCLFLQIPSIPPTNLATCKIIGVEYILQLEMEIYGKQNIKGQLPIFIGTIPLINTFKNFISYTKTKKTKEQNINIEKKFKSISEILDYPGLVSPMFEEAKTYSLNSTTSYNGISSSTIFIKPPGKHLNHFCKNMNQNNSDEEENNKEDDSDDEYYEGRKHKEDLDHNFIPSYAKYISVYGED